MSQSISKFIYGASFVSRIIHFFFFFDSLNLAVYNKAQKKKKNKDLYPPFFHMC